MYKEAKSKRVVLNKEEFASALEYSRGHLHRLMTGIDDVPDELITKARGIANNTINVTLAKTDQKDRINVIEAKLDVLLKEFVTLKSSVLKESPTKIALELENLVVLAAKQRIVGT